MKHYLNWALANLASLSELDPEQAKDLVHDAYYSAIGEVLVIGCLAAIPLIWVGRKLLSAYFDLTTATAILAVSLGFASAKPIDWYVKRRIAMDADTRGQ